MARPAAKAPRSSLGRVGVSARTLCRSSFLEHRAGEIFYGPRQFSAVKLLQLANQGGVSVRTFTDVTVDDALDAIQWPAEFEERLRDAAGRGLTVQAPVAGHSEPGLGTFFGFIATDPVLGAVEYIVAFQGGTANGGVGDAAGEDSGGGDSNSGCLVCQGNAPGEGLIVTRSQLGFRERMSTMLAGS